MWPRKCVSMRGFLCYLSVFGLPLVQFDYYNNKKCFNSDWAVSWPVLGQITWFLWWSDHLGTGFVSITSSGHVTLEKRQNTLFSPLLFCWLDNCHTSLASAYQVTTSVTNIASTKSRLYLCQFSTKSHGVYSVGYRLLSTLSALCKRIM